MISIVSLSLLLLFITACNLKLSILRVRGIKGYHLAQRGKVSSRQERLVFLASALGFSIWGAEAIFACTSCPFPLTFQVPAGIAWFGILVTASGIGLFCAAMIKMKNSWRVGIDRTSKTALIAKGIYSKSRNPAFLGINLVFLGLLITFPGLFSLIASASNAAALHILILKEEEHWTAIGGKDYDRYRKRVPRYFSFKMKSLI
jgi:protein-S-isoprenylcysteine O-methyltransferase Ste14